jgi:hypothetical protein
MRRDVDEKELEELNNLRAENARLRTDYQVMKAALIRCQNEILSKAPSGPLIPAQPSGVNFRDRFGKRSATARENVSFCSVVDLHEPPRLRDPKAIEVDADLPPVFEGEGVEVAQAVGGLHVEEASVHNSDCRTDGGSVERAEVEKMLDEEYVVVIFEIETLVRGEVEKNNTELVRMMAASKQAWMIEAALGLRNRLLARLSKDFSQK